MTKNLSHAREKNLMIQAKANTVVNQDKRNRAHCFVQKRKRKKRKKERKRRAFWWSYRLGRSSGVGRRSAINRHDAPPLLIAFATLGFSILSRRFAALVRKHHTSKASLRSGNLQGRRTKDLLCQKRI